MRYASLLFLFLIVSTTAANDWLTAPGFYTHDRNTGLRTHQYQTPPPAVVQQPADFRSSGFRHYRSTLQHGSSADNYHRVEEWGPPVVPYGEWRFPFRPYSVPYDQWGPPFAGLNTVAPWGGWFPGGGAGFPGVGPVPQPGIGSGSYPYPTPYPYPNPYPSGPNQIYPAPPYADGYYPDYPRPRMNDSQFYNKPQQN